MKIRKLSLSEIRPYWRNPRKNERAIDAVAESIKRYGFTQPIVVDEENTIVAGHTRYKALQRLGATSVECVVLSGLSPERIREYRIADNKTSELAEWDMATLIPELRTISEIGSMQVFFGDEDVSALLKETAGAGIDFKLPEQSAIDARQEQLNTQFTDRSQAAQSDYIEVTCPHCAESFHVSASEIANRVVIAERNAKF